MNIIINEAREPNEDFWRLSGVLEPTKWTKNPFIILQEKSDALLVQEQLEAFDRQIKLEQMYTESMWKDSSHRSDRERYESAVKELEVLNKQKEALAKRSVGRKKTLQIHIVEKLTDVLQYSDECIVLKQWPGNWRSDFFKLTVGMLREKTSI